MFKMAAGEQDVHVKYTGKKISKVRWRPVSAGHASSSDFICGSWDDEKNSLSLWKCELSRSSGPEKEYKSDLTRVSEDAVSGDVMDICWLPPSTLEGSVRFLSALGDGSLRLYDISTGELNCVVQWSSQQLHQRGACTSVCYNGDRVVMTAGEDSCLCIIRVDDGWKVSRRVEEADSACINDAKFYTNNEVIHVSSCGHFVVRDLRSNEKPLIFTYPSCPGIHCLDQHSSQTNKFGTGMEDGSVVFWDLRNNRNPDQVLAAHSGTVTDVRWRPPCFVSSSQNGCFWLWKEGSNGFSTPSEWRPHGNFAVNSVDLEGCHLLAGTDGEALYFYRSITKD